MQGVALRLPVELICYIFGLLPPCDIVRLRRVSKQFRDVSLDPIVWREHYARAHLPLPPGPFRWQSTQYLEHALVRSYQLSKTWTSQPAQIVSRRSCKLDTQKHHFMTFLFGRWGIWQQKKKLYCQNINTGTTQMLYDGSDEDDRFDHVKYATSADGQCVYVILSDHYYPEEFLKLLVFNAKEDSLSEPKIYDLLHPEACNEHQDHFYSPTPFLLLSAFHGLESCMVVDISTPGLYTLPRFMGDALDALPAIIKNVTLTRLVLTRTHLIAFRMIKISLISVFVIQAFVAPDSPHSPGVGELRLTHQTAFYEEHLVVEPRHNTISNLILLRNSVVDPVTKSINIKLLDASKVEPGNEQRLSLLDLTLPASSSAAVAPIQYHTEELFTETWFSLKHTASDDGHARGILVSDVDGDPQSEWVAIRKFTIDASGATCTAKVGDPSSIAVPRRLDWEAVEFDGVTGKLHYQEWRSRSAHLVTVDIS